MEKSTDEDFESNFEEIIISTPDAVNYSDSGLSEDTEYFCRIKSYNDDLESDYSDQTSATTHNETEIIYDPIDISIPVYDSDNSEHFIIDENSYWDHINDADKRIFFVAPGDYSDYDLISLTASGTEESPRFLVYYNPANPNDDRHPVDIKEDNENELYSF